MQGSRVKDLLAASHAQGSVEVRGWVRTRRDSRGFAFLEVNDGSCLNNIQCIHCNHI